MNTKKSTARTRGKDSVKGVSDMSTAKELRALEKRISAIERDLNGRKKSAEEVVSSWENVLLEFADRFGLDASKLRGKILRQKEEHP